MSGSNADVKDRYALIMLHTFAADNGLCDATQVDRFVDGTCHVCCASHIVRSSLKQAIIFPAIVPSLLQKLRGEPAEWAQFHAGVVALVEREMTDEARHQQCILDVCQLMLATSME